MFGRDSNPVKSPSETGHDLHFHNLGCCFCFVLMYPQSSRGKL